MDKSHLNEAVARRRFVAKGSFWALLLISPLAFLARQAHARVSENKQEPRRRSALKPKAPGFSFPAPTDVALYLDPGDEA